MRWWWWDGDEDDVNDDDVDDGYGDADDDDTDDEKEDGDALSTLLTCRPLRFELPRRPQFSVLRGKATAGWKGEAPSYCEILKNAT